MIKEHILLPFAGPIAETDAESRRRLPPDILAAIVDQIPADWLTAGEGFPDPAVHRAAYLAYLTRRIEAADAFVEEAERARVTARAI